ncbi:VOC family protein [Actinophytocola xinjiangensis]|nr:VOC family protein [Actinophytocola xinjiangensis]
MLAMVRQVQVTFDCAEPETVARFWSEVLGYSTPSAADGWAACADPDGVGPRLYFQRVPEGKVVKNRVHLDVRVARELVGAERVAALEAECARLVALGGTRVELLPADEVNESIIIMRDVEGNEFCLT